MGTFIARVSFMIANKRQKIRNPFEFFQAAKYKLGYDRKYPLIKWIKENAPSNILEVGVFNGVFASRMLNAALQSSTNVSYVGCDLFSDLQDEVNYHNEVSLWAHSLESIQSNLLAKFPRVQIEMVKGYSDETLPSLLGRHFDLIFIDGGHSENTVRKDWEICSRLLAKDGAIFFDDYTNLRGVRKAGYGIRKVIQEIDRSKYSIRIFSNRDFFLKPYGLLTTRLVKVVKK